MANGTNSWSQGMKTTRIGVFGELVRYKTLVTDGFTSSVIKSRFLSFGDPMPMNAQFFYGFTQFAIELNEQPPQDAVSSGHLPITDSRQRPDIRLLELGRVEEAEAENKRIEDDQRRRQKNSNSKDLDGINMWKPLWFM